MRANASTRRQRHAGELYWQRTKRQTRTLTTSLIAIRLLKSPLGRPARQGRSSPTFTVVRELSCLVAIGDRWPAFSYSLLR